MSILIVGASVAGVRTAQALRMQGCTDEITMIGAEVHRPYDKPPLSKEMLLPDGPTEPVPLLSEGELEALGVDLRLGSAARSLDVAGRSVLTEGGEVFGFDSLVIATGATPRTLPGAEELGGVYTLRNAEDALQLRAELPNAKDVVVIGAGFIGAEFASSAKAHGVAVTMVEAQPIPLAHLLGDEVGLELASLHGIGGVVVHCGSKFAGFHGDGRVSGVELADGRVLRADVVVVGIGVSPATGWLASSGLPINDGIECDGALRVRGQEAIFAVGDVARRPYGERQELLRFEHWTNANEDAGIAAAAILGMPSPRAQVPYVWSDQYGHRIQIVGRPGTGRLQLHRGTAASGGYVAAYADESGTVVGGVAVDDPRALMRLRKAVSSSLTVDALAESLGASSLVTDK